MFKMDLQNVIMMLVDGDLDRKTPPEYYSENGGCYLSPALYLRFIVRVDYRGSFEAMTMHMIFQGNTSVFYHIGKHLDLKQLTNTSNHPSCWRQDGLMFINNLYQYMCDEVAPGVAFSKIESSVSDIFTKKKQITIKYKYDDDNRKIITEVMELI